MHKIGIIGWGTVGKGIHNLFDEEVVLIHDPNIKKYSKFEEDKWKYLDMIVICVPTDANGDESADISIVKDWIDQLGYSISRECVILIKSTVPPSFLYHKSHHHNIVFSAEYMGESKYYTPPWKYPDPKDMRSHTWQVFGGSEKYTSKCVDIFKRRMSVDTRFIQTTLLTACLAKYMENTFFAMKVTFCNEWFDIAQECDVDYNELRECWLADTRINRNHTLVFPKDRGYGGKCFPKDLKAIKQDMIKRGYFPELLDAVDRVNNKMRSKNV